MEGINKKYNLEIEVLTPLSIGVGQEKDWVRGVDFVVDKGTLYKLNLKKMIANGIKIDDLTSFFALKNESGLKSKLAGKLDDVSDFSTSFPAETDNDVKAFVKNQLGGNPVLTGSSLKGAIRSVLLDYIATKDEIVNAVSEANQRRKPFESFIFGSSNDGDEFMRFIKISDAEFDKTELVNTKIFNLRGNGNNWQGGWKFSANRTDAKFQSTGFNTLYESLMPNQKGYTSLMMSDTLFDLYESKQKAHIKSSQKKPILHSGSSSLFEIINKHSRDYLLKEKAFFEKYHADRSDEIVDSINALLNQIPSDGSCCILKMSAGSGFHSITGDWQFPDNYFNGKLDRKRASKDDLKEAGKVLPKSRKIAEWNGNLSLMGFVKLRELCDEELEGIEATRIENARRKEEERLAALEEEKRKLEAEKQAERQQRETAERYEVLKQAGENLYSHKCHEEALEKLVEAHSLFPSRFELEATINELKQHVEAIRQSKALEIAKQKEIEERKKLYAVSLSDKISNAKKLPTLYGNVKQWMKQNGIDILSDGDKNVLFQKIKSIVDSMKEKERKQMKNLGNHLDTIVGSDTATAWFNKIVNR